MGKEYSEVAVLEEEEGEEKGQHRAKLEYGRAPGLGVTNHGPCSGSRHPRLLWSVRNPNPQSRDHGSPGGSWISEEGLGKLGVWALCVLSPEPLSHCSSRANPYFLLPPLFLPGAHTVLCAPVSPPTTARGPLAMLSPLKTPPWLPCAL